MFMSFSHEEVQRLIQLLDSSHFDELHLEAEGVKLSLRRNGATFAAATELIASAPRPPTAPAPNLVPSPAHVSALQAQTGATAGLLEIRAPMLGTFYSAPKPGAAPFVAVGARVGTDSVVAVIEVMKLMNSISAGVEGDVVEILVRDGELVEFDQVLMRVRPA
jgi:acetyl-CoA carboxylase biotin carboxyl carrier protein